MLSVKGGYMSKVRVLWTPLGLVQVCSLKVHHELTTNNLLLTKKQAKAEVLPSSSLVEVAIGVEAEVGVILL